MKKLLKLYGFNSDMQYFEMIVESYINGQITQAKAQFTAMPKTERKNFIVAANDTRHSILPKSFINQLTFLI